MGRTKRRRTKNRQEPNNINLGSDITSINLRKWLKQNNFIDPLNLQLRYFSSTGRGVTSKKSVQPLDVLVRVPFDLLITYDTIRKSDLLCYLEKDTSLTIQTFLALFLVMEKHKEDKSPWKSYIESLPYREPFLLWMCDSKNMGLYPADLKAKALRLQEGFRENWDSVLRTLLKKSLCKCCQKPIESIFSVDSFKWGYVLVNTRAVYIDPRYLMSTDNSFSSLLADDPFLALCPFMDLINHHHVARTKATVVHVGEQTFYQLTTMTGFKKYEQFFISYGAHSNEKLLMEYGFFIPGNLFDSVEMRFKELLEILNISLDDRQYKSIKNYKFDADELFINQNGMSFVLKAILFVAYHPTIKKYGSFIFSNRYPSDFDRRLESSTRTLLEFKLDTYKKDLRKLENTAERIELINKFSQYRVNYVQELLQMLHKNKLCFS